MNLHHHYHHHHNKTPLTFYLLQLFQRKISICTYAKNNKNPKVGLTGKKDFKLEYLPEIIITSNLPNSVIHFHKLYFQQNS